LERPDTLALGLWKEAFFFFQGTLFREMYSWGYFFTWVFQKGFFSSEREDIFLVERGGFQWRERRVLMERKEGFNGEK
jgi:hypothetical protein